MSVQLLSMACNNCGAPLRVPADVRFVTCQHCGAQLAVETQEDVAFTRKLDDISTKVDALHEALVDEQREKAFNDELAAKLLTDPDSPFQTIGRSHSIVFRMMLLFAGVFFLFVGWQFHPFIGIVMAAIPIFAGLTMASARESLPTRIARIALQNRQKQRHQRQSSDSDFREP